jgi:hypothetical protein
MAITMSNLYPEPLLKFITAARERGWPESNITAKLLAAGWAKELIIGALKTTGANEEMVWWQEATWPVPANAWAKSTRSGSARTVVTDNLSAPVVATSKATLTPALKIKRRRLTEEIITRTLAKYPPAEKKIQARQKVRMQQTQRLIAIQEQAGLLGLGLLGVIILSLLWQIFVIK